jgi:hypothetical protein
LFGLSFGVSVGCIEEADEGREMLKTESLATGIDESLSVMSIVAGSMISSTTSEWWISNLVSEQRK